MIPFLTRETCEPLLSWRELTDALLAAHKQPQAQIEDTLLARGADRLLSRAAWIDGVGVGVKSVSIFAGNAARGLPSVQGAMIVFDDTTGVPRAILENGLITRWKTAADSVLGARLLARKGAQRLLIVGAGTVAQSLIEAYGAVFPSLSITVWARRPQAARDLADAHPGVAVATDLQQAVAQADIISTCTMATQPVIKGEWLRPGQHVDLIGAYTPDMREADDTAMQRGKVFVDARATTLHHIGELMIPLASGALSESDVLADFYDLATNAHSGRADDTDITVFKNGGGAHLDLMTADYVLGRWQAGQA